MSLGAGDGADEGDAADEAEGDAGAAEATEEGATISWLRAGPKDQAGTAPDVQAARMKAAATPATRRRSGNP